MAYTPEHLREWKRPPDYMGAEWHGWYVSFGQHRDSDTLTRSNFEVAKEALLPFREDGDAGGTDDDGDEIGTTVQVVRESHWAVGWVEWIAIHKSNETALRLADELAASVEDYPVLDDSHLSQLECDEAHELWRNLSLKERVQILRDNEHSIFAARRDEIPATDDGRFFDIMIEWVRGC